MKSFEKQFLWSTGRRRYRLHNVVQLSGEALFHPWYVLHCGFYRYLHLLTYLFIFSLMRTYFFRILTYSLFYSIENHEYENIIAWQPDGNSFIIKNTQLLEERVLPLHFKHNNCNSFIRLSPSHSISLIISFTHALNQAIKYV